MAIVLAKGKNWRQFQDICNVSHGPKLNSFAIAKKDAKKHYFRIMTNQEFCQWTTIYIVGGSAAGIAVWITQAIRNYVKLIIDKRRVYLWLYKNTVKKNTFAWRNVRTIASFTNLTEERAKYVCSVHKKICQNTVGDFDQFGLIGHARDKSQKDEFIT